MVSLIKRQNIQDAIEKSVTSERGYDRKNTSETPKYILNTEIGLQIALANMDATDGKMGGEEILCFNYQLDKMINKYENAAIPLSTITDANGFRRAFDSAYAKKGMLNSLSWKPLSPKEENILQESIMNANQSALCLSESPFSGHTANYSIKTDDHVIKKMILPVSGLGIAILIYKSGIIEQVNCDLRKTEPLSRKITNYNPKP